MNRIWVLTALLLFGAVSSHQAPGPVLFRQVRVFDGTRMLPARDVLIRDGVIARIDGRIAPPEGAEVIEGANRTLLPGLIDSHTHIFGSALEDALVFGVTTELDMFTVASGIPAMRAQQARADGARLADFRTAGTLVTAPGGHGTEYGFPIPTIEKPEEAQAFVDARIAEGSDYIKMVYDDGHTYGRKVPTISQATLQAVTEAAHRRGRMAMTHVQSLRAAREALGSGVDGLVHLFVDSMPEAGFGRLAARRQRFVIPTLSVLKSITGVSPGTILLGDSSLAPYIGSTQRQGMAAAFPRDSSLVMDYRNAIAAVHQLKAANVPILAGTDAPNPGTAHGPSLHGELELLVEAGLTPLEALRAATSTPAAVFHLGDRGRIQAGLRADLVLVEGDPSRDIRATRQIVGVWKAGVGLDRNRRRSQVAAERAQQAAEAATPAGIESGTISSFDDGTTNAAFGKGWELSTDQIAGGKSTGDMMVEAGALAVRGTVDPGLPYAWSGAMFSPGTASFVPANLSSRRSIRFSARGDGKTYRLMIFAQSKGRTPLQQTFVAGPEWKDYSFPFNAFDGIDGGDVMAILWVAGPAGGEFSFQIDEVRLE